MIRTLSLTAIAGLALAGSRVGAQQYDLRVFGVEDGLPGSTVNSITQDSVGYLWVDTDGGWCRFDGRTFHEAGSWTPVIGRDTRSATRELVARTTGQIWKGSDVGITIYSAAGAPVALSGLYQENGLGSNDVTCLFEDRSGVIWIGTRQGGLCRYTSGAITTYGTRGGPFGRARSLFRWAGREALLVGGKEGFGIEFRTPTGTAYRSLSWLDVRGLTVIPGERILAATDSGAVLFLLPNGEAAGLQKAGHLLPEYSLNGCITFHDGVTWLATERGIITVQPDLSTIRVARDTIAVTAMTQYKDSVLIGTGAGLYVAPLDNSAANWTRLIRAGDEDITALAADRAGNIWIGTSNRGVIRYRRGGSHRWSSRDGLASDRVQQLLLDAYQNLWVGTDRGFDLMELDELQEEVIDIRYFGVEDGFPGIEATPQACLLDTDSSLWFGTTRGTIRYEPRNVLEDPVPPHTRITDLALFFEHPDWRPWCDSLHGDGLPTGLHLPYDRDHLTFTFSGLSLAYPEKVRFQYKLEGRDAEWSPIITEDHVTYSGLEPGAYTFLVKARNGSGVWNDEPAQFAFSITPPFWKTTAFRVGGIVALIALFFGLQHMRDRRSRKARARLERLVDERTRELSGEKHRSDQLLLNILPETTAAELKANGIAQARHYDDCTVLFSDFQGFTMLSELLEATGIVTELDRFFRAFDRITDKYGVEKIKTIGDAYMCASGVPDPSPTHALDGVLMALEMLSVVDEINADRMRHDHPAWPIRIGLHSGPLIAGVVGEKKFAYDVWGNTVNLASRMESSGAPGRVNVTGSTLRLVEHFVVFEARGTIKLKGKGDVECWFIDRLRPEYSRDEQGRTANDTLIGIRKTLRSTT